MNKAYQNMRDFWLDVKNLENKKGIDGVGDFDICIAGVEMSMPDSTERVKNLLVAASVLGDCSLYFENNSPIGLGGFVGGAENGNARELGFRMIGQAARMPAQMDLLSTLSPVQQVDKVLLFCVAKDGRIFGKELLEKEARHPDNPFYPFFAYSQQLIGAFRTQSPSDTPCCGN